MNKLIAKEKAKGFLFIHRCHQLTSLSVTIRITFSHLRQQPAPTGAETAHLISHLEFNQFFFWPILASQSGYHCRFSSSFLSMFLDLAYLSWWHNWEGVQISPLRRAPLERLPSVTLALSGLIFDMPACMPILWSSRFSC